MKNYLKYIWKYFLVSLIFPLIVLSGYYFNPTESTIPPRLMFTVLWLICLIPTIGFSSIMYASDLRNKKALEVRKMILMDMTYKNYKGEVGNYTIYPLRLVYGATEFHKTPQWLLVADKYNTDNLHEQPKLRMFAMKDIVEIK